MDKSETILMAVFSDADQLLKAVKAMLSRGSNRLEVLSPFSLPELDELLPQSPSKVRWYTLVGTIGGGAAAMAFMIMTVLLWPMITGGKYIVTISAFVPITFEVFILVGGVATLVGLFFHARLPGITLKPSHDGASQDDFAIFVAHRPSEYAALEAQLREAGAREVRPYNPVSSSERIME